MTRKMPLYLYLYLYLIISISLSISISLCIYISTNIYIYIYAFLLWALEAAACSSSLDGQKNQASSPSAVALRLQRAHHIWAAVKELKVSHHIMDIM